MAVTRDQMKETIRASAIDVISPQEYAAELREFIAVTGVSMTEMAAIGLEVLQER
jgi:hypothetical protein